MSKLVDRVREIAAAHPEMRRAEIAEAAGCTPSTVFLALGPSGTRRGPPKDMRLRTEIAARAQANPATLREIGDAFGISAERVRQLLAPDVAEQRKAARKQLRTPPSMWPRGPRFVTMVRRWLRAIGCDYCPACRGAVSRSAMTRGTGRECKPCAARRAHERYHSETGQERAIEYRQKNAERIRKYHREYKQRKKEPVQ